MRALWLPLLVVFSAGCYSDLQARGSGFARIDSMNTSLTTSGGGSAGGELSGAVSLAALVPAPVAVGGLLGVQLLGVQGTRSFAGISAGMEHIPEARRDRVSLGGSGHLQFGTTFTNDTIFSRGSMWIGFRGALTIYLGPDHRNAALNQNYWFLFPTPELLLGLDARYYHDAEPDQIRHTLEFSLNVGVRFRFRSDLLRR